MCIEPTDKQLTNSSENNQLTFTDLALMFFTIFCFSLSVFFLALNVFSNNVSQINTATLAAITSLLFMSTLYSVINAATKR